MVYLLALVAAIGWGTADFVQGKASKVANGFAVTFWSTVLWIPASCIVLAVAGTPFDAGDFGWGLLGGLFCAVGMPLFAAALSGGRMSVIAPVSASSTALIPFFAGTLAGERPASPQLVGAGLSLVAIVLLSTTSSGARSEDTRRLRASRDVIMGLLCGACFGGYFITLHQTSDASGIWPNLALEVAMLALVPLFARLRHLSLALPDGARSATATGAVCDWLATLGFLYATRDGLLSMVAVVSSLYPAATVVLAWLVLRERVSRPHAASLALALTGVGLIAGS